MQYFNQQLSTPSFELRHLGQGLRVDPLTVHLAPGWGEKQQRFIPIMGKQLLLFSQAGYPSQFFRQTVDGFNLHLARFERAARLSTQLAGCNKALPPSVAG